MAEEERKRAEPDVDSVSEQQLNRVNRLSTYVLPFSSPHAHRDKTHREKTHRHTKRHTHARTHINTHAGTDACAHIRTHSIHNQKCTLKHTLNIHMILHNPFSTETNTHSLSHVHTHTHTLCEQESVSVKWKRRPAPVPPETSQLAPIPAFPYPPEPPLAPRPVHFDISQPLAKHTSGCYYSTEQSTTKSHFHIVFVRPCCFLCLYRNLYYYSCSRMV